MTRPTRLQLSRKKGFSLQALSLATNGLEAVNVARPSQWGNKYTVEQYGSRAAAVDMEQHDLSKFECFHPEKFERWIAPLRGKNLACWCPLDGEPCHADVLLDLANSSTTQGKGE